MYTDDVDVSNAVPRRHLVGAEELFPNFRQARSISVFLPSFLPSFVTRNFASFSSRQLSGPLSTLILISRIPPSVDAAGRFFCAIEGVRIVCRE